ncbi:MAG: hypothetical protein ACI9FU_002430 [Granulosicoccus sp.]|jgi:hypothetical protein
MHFFNIHPLVDATVTELREAKFVVIYPNPTTGIALLDLNRETQSVNAAAFD